MTADGVRGPARLEVAGRAYRYYSLAAVAAETGKPVSRLPYCLKVLLENVVRQRAAGQGDAGDVDALLRFLDDGRGGGEIRFRPERVMMDDTAGLPLLGDLAAMRDAVTRVGADPRCIDPVIPVDFIVDHSIIAEHTAAPDALARNAALEFERNTERFAFLRWAGQAFSRLRVVPPGNGICHQINLEHLAQVVRVRGEDGGAWLVPDSMVGIDSHTPMVNSLGIVGWGVSGIEGVAAAIGEAISVRLPDVVGIRLIGSLRPGVTATDLVLTLTEIIRRRDLVGAFVEYGGPGLDHLSLPERATVANMTPECGTTMSFFPIDAETLRYLLLTGRSAEQACVVETYARAQGLWRDATAPCPRYSDAIDLDLASIEPSMAGPGQPHHRVGLGEVPRAFTVFTGRPAAARAPGDEGPLRDGDVVIAAVTSCTNTSNPAGMIGAGLLARNAVARGLERRPWVKTSLSPGSRVVAEYLAKAGLQASLDALGFHVTGFGCMTCVGFSGALGEPVASAVREGGLAVAAVTSGNRNYQGRVHPLVRASFLASPPLVVACAITGTVLKDLSRDPVGEDRQGRPVYLDEIWPDAAEVERVAETVIDTPLFSRVYAALHDGGERWRGLAHPAGPRFAWNPASTFIRRPPDFDNAGIGGAETPRDIRGARVLAIFGDLVTTEHVSPMGPVPPGTPAADYLRSIGVPAGDLGTYAARRLVADVMTRGTFSSPHLVNAMLAGESGGHTLHQPGGERMTIFEAACRYREQGTPLVVVAGRQYGTGSSRDWSAKGPRLLGVRAIIAESFERLHRANLVATGVLPLSWANGMPRPFTGAETLDIEGVAALRRPRAELVCRIRSADGTVRETRVLACIETAQEVSHFRDGGTYRHLLRHGAPSSMTHHAERQG